VGEGELAPLVEGGTLHRVQVDGWPAPGYAHADHAAALARAASGRLRATHTTLLSPFDPVVWDRDRVQALFGFGYRIECYVPAPKRQYGYYVLPVLHRGRLVGRLDAKMHRADALFEVKSFWLEPAVKSAPSLLHDVAAAIVRCARWHGATRVRYGQISPRGCAAALRAATREAHAA
jgi:uncharacterized protein YcaQ